MTGYSHRLCNWMSTRCAQGNNDRILAELAGWTMWVGVLLYLTFFFFAGLVGGVYRVSQYNPGCPGLVTLGSPHDFLIPTSYFTVR